MKIYENVMDRVHMVEEKNGIHYAKKDGKLYIITKVIYSVAFIYTIGINLLFILGMILVNSGTDNFSNILNSLITVSVCTGLLITGYIFSFFKFDLLAGIMSFVPSVFLLITFALILKDDLGYYGFKASFYYRHLIPLALMLITITIMTIVAVRAKYKLNSQYKKVLENIYNMYNLGDNGESFSTLTDEQWDEFLQKYDPRNYKNQFKLQEELLVNQEKDDNNSNI